MQRRSQHTSLITGVVYFPACFAPSGVRQDLGKAVVPPCLLKEPVRKWLSESRCYPSVAVVVALFWGGRGVTGVETCRGRAFVSKRLGFRRSGS
uniref:Uncharacterized protein n=1 Tax=Mus spicilegus TaxID=10103 RepID=A0A8C6H8D5_MUSSI